jgi:hypothetical protein
MFDPLHLDIVMPHDILATLASVSYIDFEPPYITTNSKHLLEHLLS